MTDAHGELVERVAKAIWAVSFRPNTDDNSWDGQGVSDETRACVREEARAAIAAMDDGWRDISSAPRNQLVLIANSGLGHVDRQIACRKDYAKSGWVDQWGQPIPVSAKPTRYHLLPSLPGAKP